MSGASFTACKTKKGYITACIRLTSTTTKIGQPVGPNTILIGKKSIRLRKSVKLDPMLPTLLRNQLAGTFP